MKGVDYMPLSKGTVQISVVLPKEVVGHLDAVAESNYYTRSQQAARIIIEHLKQQLKEDSK
jgi:metal-responsive CopG/Arc/MetJ family transcriptional regulator